MTVAVTNPPPTLQPGMTATVNVITFQKQNVLTVPRAVVTTKAGKATVQVPDANGKLRSVDVTTGVSDATSIEITGGLHEGDAVAQMAPKQRPATAPRAATPGAGGRQPSVFIGGGPGGPPPGAP